MRTHADPVLTMQRLEEFSKQRLGVEIEHFGAEQYSAGPYVRLYCIYTKKEVVADAWEFFDAFDGEYQATYADVIALALDRRDGLVPQYGEEDS